MSEQPNPYAQYRAQKAMARLQRRMQGADTRLDEAEVRHEAIGEFVYGMRHFAPLTLAAIGGALDAPWWKGMALCCGALILSFVLARGIATMMDKMLGAFHPRILVHTDNLMLVFLGLALAGAGWLLGLTGLVIAGLALAAMPPLWRAWSQRVMRNTDFARMRRTLKRPTRPHIME